MFCPGLSCPRKTYNFMCGVPVEPPKHMTKEQLKAQMDAMTSITENALWSRVCDYNAVIAIALTCLIIGFYA